MSDGYAFGRIPGFIIFLILILLVFGTPWFGGFYSADA